MRQEEIRIGQRTSLRRLSLNLWYLHTATDFIAKRSTKRCANKFRHDRKPYDRTYDRTHNWSYQWSSADQSPITPEGGGTHDDTDYVAFCLTYTQNASVHDAEGIAVETAIQVVVVGEIQPAEHVDAGTGIAKRSELVGRITRRIDAAYDYTRDVMVENMLYRDTEEGIAAFIEKRAPDWTQ